MIDFEIMNKKREELCKFCFNDNPGEMLFSINGDEFLRNTGVSLGILKEKNGFEEKCRLHQSEKNGWYWVETETRHPFGPEPVIKHKYEQAGNHLRVTTDIQISHKLAMENILVDNLELYGPWEKLTIYDYDESTYKLSANEYSIAELKSINLKKLPIAILLEDSSGRLLEIGSGYDLWRWSINGQYDAEKYFVISMLEDKKGINFKRVAAEWPEEFEMNKKDFRFTWYFAWSNRQDISLNKKPEKLFQELRMKNNKLISGNIASCGSDYCLKKTEESDLMLKSSIPHICYSSRQFNNAFKHWIRKIYNQQNNFGECGKISLGGLLPGICSASSHLGNKRKGKENILHYDYPFVIGFWEWANKYMAEKDLRFCINLDSSSILKDLPSAVGMQSDLFQH